MDNLVGRKVVYAMFHQGLFIPGFGNLGTTLPSSSKTLEITLTHAIEGLYLTAVTGKVVAEALVPWANVVLVKYDGSTKVVNSVKVA